MRNILLLFIGLILLVGCKTTQSTAISMQVPWDDTTMPAMGITRDMVLAQWGNPDQIIDKGFDKWGNNQEEWIYIGAYPDLELPLNYRYVKNSNHFHFAGNTVIKREINPIPIPT